MTLLRHFTLSWQKPIVKNVVNVFFWTFISFGLYLLLLAREPLWEYPRFQGVISFFSATCIALPFLVYHRTRLREQCGEYFLYVAEVLIALPLSLNGLGALYFFDMPWEYDSFIHFLNSLLAALLIYTILGAFLKTNTFFTRTVLFFLAVGGAFFFGILNEAWEFFSDTMFHTRTWGQIGQNTWYDTEGDLFYDALGSGLGALLLFFLGRQWLSQLRRVSPKIRAIALSVKDRAEDHMREQISLGKEKLQEIRVKGIARIDTTKKRLRRMANRRSNVFGGGVLP